MGLMTNSKYPLTDGFVMREYADRAGSPLTAAECLDFARSLERKLAAAERDAARWREHVEVWRAGRLPGALYVRMTMQPEASGADQAWHTEYVFDTRALGRNTVLGLKAIGMSVEQKAKELFTAIDAALSQEGNPNHA